MRKLLWLVLATLPACGNSYHPEYHPVTSMQYQQTLSYPVSVHPANGQGVIVSQAPAPAGMPMPAMPQLTPPPRVMDPSEMW